MKQKNVVLVVVAAACGLAAAVLTTQMTGKPAAPDQVEILAAAKELPVGTKLDKQKLSELIKRKKVSKSEVPQEGVFFTEDDLADKYIQRPRGVDDVILVSDVGARPPGLRPPAGKHLVTLKLPYENVGPFIEPGSKVDVECAVQTQIMKKLRQFTLLVDVQVLAVDTMSAANGQQKGDGGRPQVNTVTVALTPEEARWYQIATRLGSDIRLLVRGDESKKQRPPTTDDLERAFFESDFSGPGGPDQKKGNMIKLWVPRNYLSAGTEITEEAIRDKFREKEFEELEAPKDGVTDLTEYLGKYLVRDAERGEPLGRDAFGEKPAEKDPVKPAPMSTDPSKVVVPKVEVAPMPRKLERKPIRVWEPEITSPMGSVRHRYEMFDEKEGWIYRGVVGKDGTVTPGPAPEKAPNNPPDGKLS